MFVLPKLPFNLNDLEPIISRRTMEFHYLRHHQSYINKLNELIENSDFENLDIEEIINASRAQNQFADIYNNAGQVWNHNFFWKSLIPNNANSKPEGKLALQIESDFGSFESLKLLLHKKAVEQFGSGWVWLAKDENNNLMVYSTANADNPLIHKHKALLTIDVWEHSYYLDYQNLRSEYLSNVIDNLLNWDFASANY